MKKILVIGSINMDYVVDVDHFPAPGETIIAKSLERISGGKGANQAYAVGKLGGNVAMLGCVGADEAGSVCIQNLKQVNVDVRSIRTTEVSTGFANILVAQNGENTITVFSGANNCVTPAYIAENTAMIADCDILLIQLEIPMEAIRYLVDLAREMNKVIILDPAPINGALDDALLSKIDYIKPNESEFTRMIGSPVTLKNAKEQCRVLSEKGVGCILATLGEKGVYVYRSEQECFYLPATEVLPVDTTAAGDAFIGAFALSLSQGKNLRDAVAFAINVAAIVVTRKGAQSSIPDASELNRLMG